MKQHTHLSDHLLILKHRYPDLAEELARAGGHPDIEWIHGDDRGGGRINNFRLCGKYIHSPRDPVREAERMAQGVPRPGRAPAAHVVFGIGMGYLAEAVLGRLPAGGGIIMVEPDIRIFRSLLECVDLRALLGDARVKLVAGRRADDLAVQALREFHQDGLDLSGHIQSLSSYADIFSVELNNLRAVVARHLNEIDIDERTKSVLWDIWNRNLIENLKPLLTSAPVRGFHGAFQDIPAVLVGAGPSLDDNMDTLARLRPRSLIIAVDTALATLLAAGVIPDVILAVDSLPANVRDFENLPAHESILLFDSFCHPLIPVRYPARRRIMSMTGHLLTQTGDRVVEFKNGLLPLLEHILRTHTGFLQNGGSVITAAFDLAWRAGCRPIGLVGVDLSYPGRLTHSRSSNQYRSMFPQPSRFIPPEYRVYSDVSDKARVKVQAYSGGRVDTNRVLLMYKHWMESASADTGIACAVIGNSRGAVLKGYPLMSVEEFLNRAAHGRISDRNDIDDRLARCAAVGHDIDRNASILRLRHVRRELDRLDDFQDLRDICGISLDDMATMGSYDIGIRLKTVLRIEPERDHAGRRQQAVRAARTFIDPFLDALEAALIS
ncbi:DUF115 domain-containing protein [bacterium]|nr:DUF115 domain-containing protein [bacterium]